MQIFKTLVGFSDAGNIYLCDTILFENEYWLVPEWLEAPALGEKRPARIIGLAGLKHQELGPEWPARFLLGYPMPRDVFEGRTPPETTSGLRVVERPEIVLTIPKGIH